MILRSLGRAGRLHAGPLGGETEGNVAKRVLRDRRGKDRGPEGAVGEGGEAGPQASPTRISRLPTLFAGETTPCSSICSTSRAARW